jgi:hypothetical protein
VNLSPRIGALISIFLSNLCLAVGFIAVGQWLGLALVVFILLAWLMSRRSQFEWLVVMALPSAVILAAMGMWGGASPYLMIPGATLGLVGWDLTLFDQSLADDAESPAASRLVRKHYTALGLVLGVGLLAAFAGRIVSVQLPFVVILVLAAALAFFLERAWRTFHH